MKLALGMIVKNEESRILISLNSCVVDRLIDTFVILDTGSTDKTCEIITEFQKRHENTVKLILYHTKFIDFSTTRNELLAKINADRTITHILLLDANDELIVNQSSRSDGFGASFFVDPLQVDKQFNLKRYIQQNPQADAFLTTQLWQDIGTEAGPRFTRFKTLRLIKNDSRWRYKGVVHETLFYASRHENIVELPASVVLYQDRVADANKSFARYARDIELLTAEYLKDPTNSRTVYYLANSYYFSHDYENAIKFYTIRITKFPPIDEEYYQSLMRIGMCHCFLGHNFTEQFPWFWRAWEMLKNIEPIVFIARHYYDRNDFVTAYMFTKLACQLSKPNTVLHIDDSIYDYKRWYLASMLFHRFGDFEDGYQASLLALQYRYAPQKDQQELKQNLMAYETKLQKCSSSLSSSSSSSSSPSQFIHFDCDDGGSPLIVIFGGWSYRKWNGNSVNSELGIGGSETAAIYVAEELTKIRGYNVVVFCDTPKNETIRGVEYRRLCEYESFLDLYYIDTLIVLRYSDYIRYNGNIRQVFLWLEDVTFIGKGFYDNSKLKGIVTLCKWHQETFKALLPEEMKDKVLICGNAISDERINNPQENEHQRQNFNNQQKKPFRFVYSSCPSRGLRHIVAWWKEIRELTDNTAELHIYSDFNNRYVQQFDYIPELLNTINDNVDNGIFNHNRKPQRELFDELCKCDIWLYPTDFNETYCITALEMQLARVLCIYSPIGSLPEVVADRGIVAHNKDEVMSVLRDLKSGKIKREDYIDRAEEWARNQTWSKRAQMWDHFINNQ